MTRLARDSVQMTLPLIGWQTAMYRSIVNVTVNQTDVFDAASVIIIE